MSIVLGKIIIMLDQQLPGFAFIGLWGIELQCCNYGIKKLPDIHIKLTVTKNRHLGHFRKFRFFMLRYSFKIVFCLGVNTLHLNEK